MKRMLVIGDTHGYVLKANEVVEKQGPWDKIVHLGDCVEDAFQIEDMTGIPVAAVCGNNEYPAAKYVPDERVVELDGARIYMTHGHTLDINPHLGEKHMEEVFNALYLKAQETHAKVVLFGHTHMPVCFYQQDVLFLNPGGIGLGDRKKTYGIVSVNDDGQLSAEINEL